MDTNTPNEVEVARCHINPFSGYSIIRTFAGQGSSQKSWKVNFKPTAAVLYSGTIRYKGQCQIGLISGHCIFGTEVAVGQVASSSPNQPRLEFSNLLQSQGCTVFITYRRARGCQCDECSPKPELPPPLNSLSLHLGELFESSENADVVFEIRSAEPVKTHKKFEKSPDEEEEDAEEEDAEEEDEEEQEEQDDEDDNDEEEEQEDDEEEEQEDDEEEDEQEDDEEEEEVDEREDEATALDSWVELRAHKVILCARVPYFKGLFESGMKEALSGRIVIQDAEPEYFRQVVQFIYSGQLPSDLAEKPEKYLPIADKYGIDDLKAASSKAARKLLKKENVVQTLVMADLHHCGYLKAECIDSLKKWKAKLGENAMDPLERYPKLMMECLKKF